METEGGLDHEEVHVEWDEVDPQEATCNREPETGSVPTRAVITRTLPGAWSVTSAKLLNLKASGAVLHFLPAVKEVGAGWGCAAAGAWTAVVRQEDLGAPVVSGEAGEATAADSEDEVEWTGEASVERAAGDHPWTGWVAEADEGWAHLEERWT